MFDFSSHGSEYTSEQLLAALHEQAREAFANALNVYLQNELASLPDVNALKRLIRNLTNEQFFLMIQASGLTYQSLLNTGIEFSVVFDDTTHEHDTEAQ